MRVDLVEGQPQACASRNPAGFHRLMCPRTFAPGVRMWPLMVSSGSSVLASNLSFALFLPVLSSLSSRTRKCVPFGTTSGALVGTAIRPPRAAVEIAEVNLTTNSNAARIPTAHKRSSCASRSSGHSRNRVQVQLQPRSCDTTWVRSLVQIETSPSDGGGSNWVARQVSVRIRLQHIRC